jgi:hypothetical protein
VSNTGLALISPTNTHTQRVLVHASEFGGWDVDVDFDGRLIKAGHYTDWHRVERRCASLEAQLAAPTSKEWTDTSMVSTHSGSRGQETTRHYGSGRGETKRGGESSEQSGTQRADSE